MLTGVVIDSETHEPIANVVIKPNFKEKYIVTDSSGQFKFSERVNKAAFKFIHVGYKEIAETIDSIRISSVEYLLFFKLQRKENALGEVVVSAKHEITNPENNIIDYEFIKNKIILLNYKVPPYYSEIVLLNEQLDTLTKTKLQIKPRYLKKDCLGNIHVFTDDSSYQLIYRNSKIMISPPYPKTIYEEKMGNCVESTNDFVYFFNKKGAMLITNSGYHDFFSKSNALKYVYVGKFAKKNGILYDVIDERHTKERDDDAKMEKLHPELKSRNSVVFRETILLNEIYAPLFIINDTVLILDFINSSINSFSNNALVSKVPISFHRTKTWKRVMLIDYVEGKIYSKHIEDGKLVLKHINCTTGAVVKKCILPTIGTTKLKLMNGYAYYLLKSNVSFNYVLNRILLK